MDLFLSILRILGLTALPMIVIAIIDFKYEKEIEKERWFKIGYLIYLLLMVILEPFFASFLWVNYPLLVLGSLVLLLATLLLLFVLTLLAISFIKKRQLKKEFEKHTGDIFEGEVTIVESDTE